tara:strand:- start:153 stop:290 length:138 start_codon:yes stop_codon:yes gene_type:complete
MLYESVQPSVGIIRIDGVWRQSELLQTIAWPDDLLARNILRQSSQ